MTQLHFFSFFGFGFLWQSFIRLNPDHIQPFVPSASVSGKESHYTPDVSEKEAKHKCKINCFLYTADTALGASDLEKCILGKENVLDSWKGHRQSSNRT